MSRTFRATPFRTSYSSQERAAAVRAASQRASHGRDFLGRSRFINGYDRRGSSYLGEPWGWPWGYNDYGGVENRPRMKRHVKRQTSRIVRRLGAMLLRTETDEAISPA